MAETVQGVVDAIVQEANFDVTNATALTWLNRRHRTMVVRARALKETISVGNTVAGTTDYTLPTSVVEVYEFDVGGIPFTRGRRTDIASNAQGLLWLYAPNGAGLVVANANSSGALQFSMVPTPTSVQAISLFAAVQPADLDIANDSTLLVPSRFVEGLICGGLATGYRREGNAQLASYNDGLFDAACEEWRLDVRKQMRGSGPVQIRVVGVNA